MGGGQRSVRQARLQLARRFALRAASLLWRWTRAFVQGAPRHRRRRPHRAPVPAGCPLHHNKTSTNTASTGSVSMSRLLQVALAIVGLLLTWVLQDASNRNAQVENAQGLVQLYTQEVTAALQTCNLPMLQVAQNTGRELNELRARHIRKSETDFAAHVVDVGETLSTCAARSAAQGGTVAPTPGGATLSTTETPAPVAPELMAQS